MKKIIVAVLGLIVVVVGSALILLVVYADTFFEKYRHDIMGLAIQAKEIEVDVLAYGLTLKGVTIYPAHKERKKYLLASAEEIHVSVLPHDIVRRMIHLRKVVLIRPWVNYVRTSLRHTNWEVLNMSWLKEGDGGKKEGEMGGWKLRVDRIEIEDGHFMFRDRVSKGRFELRQMKASVSNIIDEPNPRKLPSKVKVDGKLATYNSPVSVRGRMNVLAEGLNFNFTSSIKNAPITYFAPFYAGQVPFKIRSGRISVKSKMNVLKSYLRSTHNAAISNLKVGGIHGKIINPLFLKRKTIYATATVNGDLESGKLRVSSQMSRIIGDSILSDARKASPVRKVGESIQRAGEKTGDAVRRLFRRGD